MRVVIVGGGLAGTACAATLSKQGAKVSLYEASDRLGGRLRTDVVDGFRLDHGFQVMFTAYRHAQPWLASLRGLERAFGRGAALWNGEPNRIGRLATSAPIRSAFSSAMSPSDKWRSLRFVSSLSRAGATDREDVTAYDRLRAEGISDRAIDRFWRPLFGGVFLDPDLSVSSRQFEFVLGSMARGRVVTFEGGIATFAQSMVGQLSGVDVYLKTPVHTVGAGIVETAHESVKADAIVLAVEATTTDRLLGRAGTTEFRRSVTLHFETPAPCLREPLIILNSTGKGRVNHVAPMSVVCPLLAPPGRHLASVTCLGDVAESDTELVADVTTELQGWFGRGAEQWRSLRVDRIQHGQLVQPPGFSARQRSPRTDLKGVYLAGEEITNCSIDGAIESGLIAARAVAQDMLPA